MEKPAKNFIQRRPALLLWGSLGILILSACVYNRLLEVKRQLRDFDHFYAIQGDPELVIFCKSPVILAKDMVYLIGADPLKTESQSELAHWHYEFQRVAHDGDTQKWPMDRLSLDFDLLGGKVQRLIVPTSYMQLFPRQILIELLRKMPNSEVLELRKTIVAHDQFSPEADTQLPTREKTLSLLGQPLSITKEDKLETFIYRYRIAGDKNDVPIIARLSFSSDGLLRRGVIHWGSSTFDVEFIRTTPY